MTRLPDKFWRNLAMAVLGIAVGGLFMWLALREVTLDDLRALVAGLDRRMLLQAALIYWVGLVVRVARWRLLLRELAPVRIAAVGETLIVGYAVNNLLPARLGEVARAAYAKRRLGIGRARVFGSIVIERLLDLAAILSCLVAGLAVVRWVGAGMRLPTFELVALNAGAVVGVAILAIAMLRSGLVGRFPVPEPVRAVFDDFRAGVATLNRGSALLAVLLTGGVWLCEVSALARVFDAVQVDLHPGQALLVMGAASLSTLVPTAPGYLGTYQLVAVIAMGTFGFDASAGVVAASAIQIVLFGSVTVAGLLIIALRALRRLKLAAARSLDQSSSENGVKSVPRS